MSYMNSGSISVFPSAARGQQAQYLESRLTTETVIAGIINKLIDTNGFIINDIDSWNAEDTSTPGSVHSPVEFNIYGYTFKIRNPDELFEVITEGNAIYACIALKPVATHETGEYRYELFGQDDSDLGVYQGIQFNTTGDYEHTEVLPTGYVLKSFKIFDRVGNKWVLSDDSTFKFYKKSLLFDVDGGEII